MNELTVTRGEEMRRGTVTADDLARQVVDLRRQVENIKPGVDDRVSIIVFSGDLDKMLAAFVIATGAVAMGMEAVMVFFRRFAVESLRTCHDLCLECLPEPVRPICICSEAEFVVQLSCRDIEVRKWIRKKT